MNTNKVNTTGSSLKLNGTSISVNIDMISVILFILAAITRFYKLEEPKNIV